MGSSCRHRLERRTYFSPGLPCAHVSRAEASRDGVTCQQRELYNPPQERPILHPHPVCRDWLLNADRRHPKSMRGLWPYLCLLILLVPARSCFLLVKLFKVASFLYSATLGYFGEFFFTCRLQLPSIES